MNAYKFTAANGETYRGFRWPLPTSDGPGEWVELTGKKKLTTADLCTERVLHATDSAHLFEWLKVEMYEVEIDESRGVIVADKIGFRRGRLVRRIEAWNDRTARLFACDCAEDALQYSNPKDRDTLAATIAVARRYLDGEATKEELAAAGDAAGASARASARAAAWAATWASAGASARASARAAARAAAGAAAWAAAGDAAGAAAGAAAWASAGAAAWAAAGAAAGAAAWDKYTGWLLERVGLT